jgi:hypothetical protein
MKFSDRDYERRDSGMPEEDMPYCVVVKESDVMENEAMFKLQNSINAYAEQGYRLHGHVIHFTSQMQTQVTTHHNFMAVMTR